MTENIFKKYFGIKQPSKLFARQVNKFLVKPFNKGLKQGMKDRKKYKAARKKFERKWLKQNQSWNDTRQKKKALGKAFVKEYPQYKMYVQLERLGRKWEK